MIQLKQAAYAEIEARYVCEHSVREIRCRTISDGRQTYDSQCVECGHTSSPLKKRDALAHSAQPPSYDLHLEQRRRAKKHHDYLLAYLTLRPALAAEYKAYLASATWQDRRGQVMRRANGICEICGEKALDVHHVSYRNLGAELPEDLVAVCRCCHDLIHGSAAAR
jgi:hypothetical protein